MVNTVFLLINCSPPPDEKTRPNMHLPNSDILLQFVV